MIVAASQVWSGKESMSSSGKAKVVLVIADNKASKEKITHEVSSGAAVPIRPIADNEASKEEITHDVSSGAAVPVHPAKHLMVSLLFFMATTATAIGLYLGIGV